MSKKITLNHYLKICGYTKFEGNVDRVPAQKSFLASQVDRAEVKYILEIGFNAGHSSQIFLSHSKAKVVSFDIGRHEYVKKAKTYLDSRYPDRHELIIGDSRETIPKYIQNNPNVRFDVIFIDGGHDYQVAWRDLVNCRKLAHRDTVVIVDDIVHHVKWQRRYNIGPLKAWNRMKERRLVKEKGHIDYGLGRGWSWGQYLLPEK